MSKHSFLYTKLPGFWFNFLSVQTKVIANWSKKAAIVKQFAFSQHFPNFDYLAGHLSFLLSVAIVTSHILLPFQKAQDRRWLLYQTVATYCSIPVNWRKCGGDTPMPKICSHLIFIHLGVQEDGNSFPKTLAIEIKEIIPILCEIKSKIFSAAATDSSTPRDVISNSGLQTTALLRISSSSWNALFLPLVCITP